MPRTVSVLRRSLANPLYPRTFSPVPKRVMDGSEPGEVVPGAILSGAPVDLQGRQVRFALRLPQATILHQLTKSLGYIVLPELQPSPAPGTATCGGWTGTYCKRATGGRTRSW